MKLVQGYSQDFFPAAAEESWWDFGSPAERIKLLQIGLRGMEEGAQALEAPP